MLVQKENVQYTIEEKDLQKYLSDGYKIVEPKGKKTFDEPIEEEPKGKK